MTVYLADAYSSWQKRAIENANKPIRRYIPKKADFNDFSDWKIKETQKKIKRKSTEGQGEKLNFDTPKRQVFRQLSLILHLLLDATLRTNYFPQRYKSM